MKTKLLIYIPTYNRSQLVLKQLSIISKQKSSKFDVFISDNNSTESDYVEVKKYCDDNGFKYNKNCDNLGLCVNIMNGFLHIDDYEYTLILSDDDLLKIDAIEKILYYLEKNIDFLWIKNTIIDEFKIESISKIDINESLLENIGLISAVVYKSSFIKKSIIYGYQGSLTYFPHFAMLLNAMRNQESTKIGIVCENDFYEVGEAKQEDASLRSPKMLFGFPHMCEYADNESKRIFLKIITSFLYVRYYVEADSRYYQYSEIKYLSDLSFGYLLRNSKSFLIKYYTWKCIYPFYDFVRRNISLDTKVMILNKIKKIIGE